MDKPGVQTSEFWLSLVAMVAVNLPAIYSGASWAQVAGLVGSALIALGYGVSRASVKKATAARNEKQGDQQ